MKIILLLFVFCFIKHSHQNETFTRFINQCNFIPYTDNEITQIWAFWNSQQCIQCQPWCTCSNYMECNQISCPIGHVPYSKNKICIPCPKGCKQCKLGYEMNIQSCQECNEGYQLIGKMCIELTVFQIRTSQLKEVYMVFNNPYSQPLNNQFAICQQLDSTTSLCAKCPDNYFLNEFNQCEQCPNGCICAQRGTCMYCIGGYFYSPVANEFTAIKNAGQRLQSGFYQYGSGSCVKCQDPNATECTSAFSSSCAIGYYMNNSQTQCEACNVGCSSCKSTSENCQSCQQGYYLQNESCLLCKGNTQEQINCLYCYQSDYCLQCAKNQYLSKGICYTCSEGCIQCTNTTCKMCNNGYYLKDGSCQICAENIQYCDNDTGNPSQCVYGYLLVADQNNSNTLLCIQNINNCMLMINSSQLCSQCYPSQVLFQGICIECQQKIPGCTTCTNNNNNLICSSCSSNNQNDNNYYLDINNNICTLCNEGCLSCSANQCYSCINNYYLSNGQCIQCQQQGCKTCDSQSCQICQSGYYLKQIDVQNICMLCPYGCSNCNPNGQQCTECLPSFVLRNNGCTIGTIFCAEYNELGICKSCMYGFALRNNICVSCIDFTSGYVCGENAEPCYSLILLAIIFIQFLN
ncbi:unnamed protein product [Paramecium sonneborni]|uniref:Zinc finger lsd1 subclass family protein n=1 Tax=Paramecium sonneborni TaxID=65129 RepID=A0A8S1Q7C6_9CILI|nr:unnamed protein product [Paramecium sonneborni]